MDRTERAAQIWPLLAHCATHRQTLSYELLAQLIGVPRPGLGQLLEPIQSHCIILNIPLLTSLVVGKITGLPGEGFIGAADVPEAQARVYRFDWLAHPTPSPEELKASVQRLPTNGRPLEELMEKLQ